LRMRIHMTPRAGRDDRVGPVYTRPPPVTK
jgi:hypothetical protein